MGTRAMTVPTLVPMEREMKHAAMKSPGRRSEEGRSERMRFTVASMAPMLLAPVAKAPAKTKIQIIRRIFGSEAPREYWRIRSSSLMPRVIATA